LLDPQTQEIIGIAEEKISGWQKFLRLVVKKAMLPTRVEVAAASGRPAVLVLTRGFTFFRSKVRVLDGSGTRIGYLRSKLFSLGGGFHVFSADDQRFAEVKGDWKGWNFRMVDMTGREMGIVTKKWAGLGKEFFTNADQYVIEVKESTSSNALVLAAALAIDIVFKERQG
jgi:uncharacterized protein YxjI